jgi:carbon monoxide dehydrogenase subunit G
VEIVSRIGKIQTSDDKIFEKISDFRNLGERIPQDKVKDFTANTDSCSFSIDKIGKFGMQIIEREPNKLIKITNSKDTPLKFNMWIQLKQVTENDTRVKITLRADINPFMKAMVKKPLTNFVESLVSGLEQIK